MFYSRNDLWKIAVAALAGLVVAWKFNDFFGGIIPFTWLASFFVFLGVYGIMIRITEFW